MKNYVKTYPHMEASININWQPSDPGTWTKVIAFIFRNTVVFLILNGCWMDIVRRLFESSRGASNQSILFPQIKFI